MLSKDILLSFFSKITHKRYQELLAAFSSLDNAWEGEFDELMRAWRDDTLVHEFLTWKESVDEEKLLHECKAEGISCIGLSDPAYPPLLKEIYDPPLCLFVRGKLNASDFSLAVVGARKCTPYGKQVTQEIVGPLAGAGITIVSGLAFGIDSIAHETTVNAGGKTIAVLGTGVDDAHIYPRAHQPLAIRITQQGGAVISEFPPGSEATQYSFPRRNRVIAGMTLGTLVIEAGAESGALITAQCALDNGRDVLAIPQNITSLTSLGTNNLIKMGAKLVMKPEDVLDALNLRDIEEYVTNKEILPDSPVEAQILACLSKEPVHVDMIIKQSQLPSNAVTSAMTLMEMKGKVRNTGGMMYVLAR